MLDPQFKNAIIYMQKRNPNRVSESMPSPHPRHTLATPTPHPSPHPRHTHATPLATPSPHPRHTLATPSPATWNLSGRSYFVICWGDSTSGLHLSREASFAISLYWIATPSPHPRHTLATPSPHPRDTIGTPSGHHRHTIGTPAGQKCLAGEVGSYILRILV